MKYFGIVLISVIFLVAIDIYLGTITPLYYVGIIVGAASTEIIRWVNESKN
jgi:hypothetical protein